MTRRDELYEKCEDAVFALLMEEYMEEEGRALSEENERLNADPSAAIPEDVYRRGLKTIHRAFRREQTARAGRRTVRLINKVALVALIAMILMTTAFAASPTLREKTVEFLLYFTDQSAELRINAETTEFVFEDGKYVLPQMPDGYEQTEVVESAWRMYACWNDPAQDNAMITIRVVSGENEVGLDSENTDQIEQIQINGFDGVCIEKDDAINISCADTEHNRFIVLYTTALSKKDALSLMEQIEWQSN